MMSPAALASSVLVKIPSPERAQYHLGFLPIRMYAMCILVGILVAVWMGDRRWQARGGKPQEVVDIAIWAVPFGLVGGRLYHVITTPGPYFGKDGDPIKAFYVWQGGLGIWGAIMLGAVGSYIGCRKHGASLRTFADAVAPGVVLAQACGRWGNWFNNELYGRRTTMPWGLQVHAMDPGTQTAILSPDGKALLQPGLYQPTFLYESLWCVGVALLVLWADRKFTLGYGRAFALYVAAYTVGRGWIEYLRIDDAYHPFGLALRLNDWTAMIVFIGAVVFFVKSAKKHPGREPNPYYLNATVVGAIGTVGDTAVAEEAPATAAVPESETEPQVSAAAPLSVGGEAPESERLEADTPEQETAPADGPVAKDGPGSETDVETDVETDSAVGPANRSAEVPVADQAKTKSSETSESSR